MENTKKTAIEVLEGNAKIEGVDLRAFVEQAVNREGVVYNRIPISVLGDCFRAKYPDARYEEELDDALITRSIAKVTVRIFTNPDSEKPQVTTIGVAAIDPAYPVFDYYVDSAKWKAYRSALAKLGFHIPLDYAQNENGEDKLANAVNAAMQNAGGAVQAEAGTVPDIQPEAPKAPPVVSEEHAVNLDPVPENVPNVPEVQAETPFTSPEAVLEERPNVTPRGRTITYNEYGVPHITFNTSDDTESIYEELTREQAMTELIPFGKAQSEGGMRGKPFGEMSRENLEWIVNSYKGANNLARACARKLLDTTTA